MFLNILNMKVVKLYIVVVKLFLSEWKFELMFFFIVKDMVSIWFGIGMVGNFWMIFGNFG